MHLLLVFMHILQYHDFMDYMAHHESSPSLRSQGLHAHDYFEFYIHVNGGRQYCVDDTVFGLKPFQLIIIPPLHMHGLVCDRDLVDYERCYLYISPETLKRCGFNKIDLCKLFEETCGNKRFTCELSEEEGNYIIQILKTIEKRQNQAESDYAEILEDFSLILNVLRIAQKVNSGITRTNGHNFTGNEMYRILHYINQHYTENISLKELSGLFNMSESALSHEFHKYSNKGVYEYVLYKRIIKAKELLITDSSLTQIAMDCGFNDYSNFLRVFKKFSTCSPKEYRNRLMYKSL